MTCNTQSLDCNSWEPILLGWFRSRHYFDLHFPYERNCLLLSSKAVSFFRFGKLHDNKHDDKVVTVWMPSLCTGYNSKGTRCFLWDTSLWCPEMYLFQCSLNRHNVHLSLTLERRLCYGDFSEPSLFEAALSLNRVKYHGNLQILIPLNLGWGLTLLRKTRPRLRLGITVFAYLRSRAIRILYDKFCVFLSPRKVRGDICDAHWNRQFALTRRIMCYPSGSDLSTRSLCPPFEKRRNSCFKL